MRCVCFLASPKSPFYARIFKKLITGNSTNGTLSEHFGHIFSTLFCEPCAGTIYFPGRPAHAGHIPREGLSVRNTATQDAHNSFVFHPKPPPRPCCA
jgi:hypothetical protein